MNRQSFFRHCFPGLFSIILVTVVFVAGHNLISTRRFYYRLAEESLMIRTVMLLEPIRSRLENSPALQAFCAEQSLRADMRITVIEPDGMVLADSEHEPGDMDNHADRPEIRAALAGDTGRSVRYSSTLRRDLCYIGVPLTENDTIAAVIRTSVPVRSLSEVYGGLAAQILTAAAIACCMAALLSFIISRLLSRPLSQLTAGAERFAQGDFSIPLSVPRIREIAVLARSLNTMSEQLAERISAVTRKNVEQEAILSAMEEGVIAVDLNEHILLANNAARVMLGVESADIIGKMVEETIRCPDLQKFMRRLLSERTTLEGHLRIDCADGKERWLNMHGAMLGTTKESLNGIVVVFYDITTIRRLEQVRKDFVANVSHELRTPLTSIKGFIENLRDNAVEDPRERERFLGIIEDQVNRLSSLVDDLLTLSQLEDERTAGQVLLEVAPVEPVVQNAIDACSARVREKAIRLDVSVEPDLNAYLNPSLFEQVLINLIDNAVAYSPRGETVTIDARRTGSDVSVSVTDHGVGIERRYLSRIFERFFRVDKARSKKLGGTGLGLAIVKHIMDIHGGLAQVESSTGKGSTFTVRLRSHPGN